MNLMTPFQHKQVSLKWERGVQILYTLVLLLLATSTACFNITDQYSSKKKEMFAFGLLYL